MGPHHCYRSCAIAACCTIVSVTRLAPGETVGTWLEISRAPGSEACPDVERVFRSVHRLFPEQPIRRSIDSLAAASASVRIRPTTVGHEAFVHVDRPHEGERVIGDHDVECNGLADALAVALVLLIEPERSASRRTSGLDSDPTRTNASSPSEHESQHRELTLTPPPTKTQPKPIARTTVDHSQPIVVASDRAPEQRVHASLSAMALAGVGLFSRPAAGAGASVAMSLRSGPGLFVDGLRLFAAPAMAAPGQVDLDLWSLLGGPCYRMQPSTVTTLNTCVALGIGRQTARSSGYRENGSAQRPWLVLGPRVDIGIRVSEWLEVFGAFYGIVYLKRQSFSVDEVGIVADPPSVGLMLSIGFRVGDWIF